MKNYGRSKIKFISDSHLPFKKTLELRNLIKDVRDGFHKDKKHYRKAFLDECFNKLETLYFHRTDVSEG